MLLQEVWGHCSTSFGGLNRNATLSDWCQPVPLSFQLLYPISLSSLFCLHLYFFSLITYRFTHTCAHTHAHMKHAHVCAHMYDTHRGMHTHKKWYVCLSAYLGQSYAPPAVSVILQIHLQPETENSDKSCTPLANRLSTITTNNVYVYNVHHYMHHCIPKNVTLWEFRGLGKLFFHFVSVLVYICIACLAHFAFFLNSLSRSLTSALLSYSLS